MGGSITQLGAFTQLTEQAILQQIAQQGFATTGNVYYLDPVNGNDANNGLSPATQPGGVGPVQSLPVGYALLAEGHNDVLVLIGNGLSTGTARIHATFTWAKDAAHLVGICSPSVYSQRARIAPGTSDTAFANFFVVSGNGCHFANIQWFQGFGTGVAAEICLSVSGSRNVFSNCAISGMGDATGAASATSRNLVITGPGGENLFDGCSIGLDTVSRTNDNASVEFKAGTPRNVFRKCVFPAYAGDAGELFLYTAAADAMDRFQFFDDCAFLNAVNSGATTMTTAITLAASSGGGVVMNNCTCVGCTHLSDSGSTGMIWVTGPAANAGAFVAVAPTG